MIFIKDQNKITNSKSPRPDKTFISFNAFILFNVYIYHCYPNITEVYLQVEFELILCVSILN